MDLNANTALAVLVYSFIAGFGWTVGCWLAAKLLHPAPHAGGQ